MRSCYTSFRDIRAKGSSRTTISRKWTWFKYCRQGLALSWTELGVKCDDVGLTRPRELDISLDIVDRGRQGSARHEIALKSWGGEEGPGDRAVNRGSLHTRD